MWIFLSDAFVSVVADKADPKMLMVRARRAEDLTRVFGITPKQVTRTEDSDYRFRCWVSRERMKAALAKRVDAIDYHNFKNTVVEDARHDAYLRVWTAMYAFQEKTLRRTTMARPMPNEKVGTIDYFDPYYDERLGDERLSMAEIFDTELPQRGVSKKTRKKQRKQRAKK